MKYNSKPEDFILFPLDSITKNSKSETVAKNIMLILARNGNKWRRLPWHEYKAARLKDGDFNEDEQIHFNRVIDFTIKAECAILFSEAWQRVDLVSN
jgi:hypothetical protein